MRHLSIDIETFSDVSLADAGVWAYSEGEEFEILLFAYSFDFDPEVKVVDLAQGEKIPEDVVQALNDPNVIKHAYNAVFEIVCLNHAGYTTPPDQWRCTMFHALYLGYPAGLAKTGEALNLTAQDSKDRSGKALIRYFSVPCKPTQRNGNRTRNLPAHDPDKWALFKKYNQQDVVAEMEIYKRLSTFPVPDKEQELWVLEQDMHRYGIPVDLDFIYGALELRQQQSEAELAEVTELTGLENPKSRVQMQSWIEKELGHELPNFRKATVQEVLDNDPPPQVKRALEIWQNLSKTSLAKYDAFINSVAKDNRIHGAHQIYGANRTGRWAGRLIQPQNLPRNYLPALSLAREYVKERDLKALEFTYGDLTDTLSQLIRTAIVPSEGHKLIVADFSAIEARVIAWLAGEEWVNEVFRTTGRIYEATAAKMFGIDEALIKKGNPEYAYRQKGKVATLALGYQGGKSALIAMGALEGGIPEEELDEIKNLWRQANPNIVSLWHELENAAIATVKDAKKRTVKHLTLWMEQDAVYGQTWLTIKLPSGRKLFYNSPHVVEGAYKEELHYLEARSRGMVEEKTYGGRLTENVVQAIARDCLAVMLMRIKEKGWQTIMHIHDEVVIDAPKTLSVDEVCQLMSEPIDWAPGLILKGDGFEAEFYQKD